MHVAGALSHIVTKHTTKEPLVDRVKFQFVLSTAHEKPQWLVTSEADFKLRPEKIDELVNKEGKEVEDELKKLK